MCDLKSAASECLRDGGRIRSIPVKSAVGTVLAHDITEIVPGERKGRAFKKGHIVMEEDIERLLMLGKERLYVLEPAPDEMHEDEAAVALAAALCGEGVAPSGAPKEGRVDIAASRRGLLKIGREALLRFNMVGEVMCATLHENTVVAEGRTVGATRAIPLLIRKDVVERAVREAAEGVISVLPMRRPRAGVVVTGGEVYHGRVRDAFAPVIEDKIKSLEGMVVGVRFVPDKVDGIRDAIAGLIRAGSDLIIATGGMSVDPDDVTRFAIGSMCSAPPAYGAAVLPGAMSLVGYIETPGGAVPVLGVPACGMYHKSTVLDLMLPRVLAGERIGRRELANAGHGGLCLGCADCRFPACPFGKGA